LNVIFASEGRTADALLIRRIQKVKNPSEFGLVSSDLQVVDAARARRMKSISSEDFANLLTESKQPPQSATEPSSPDEAEEPSVSQEEVAEWLELFEAAPKPKRQQAPKPRIRPEQEKRPPGSKKSKEAAAVRKEIDPALLKRGDDKLTGDEVDEWLKLFGQED
jgi:hypothetical protein